MQQRWTSSRTQRQNECLVCFVVMCVILPAHSTSLTCSNCLHDQCEANGVCIFGCKQGFADKYCRHRCQSTCKDTRCEVQKDTGKIACLSGCVDGYCGRQCKVPCPTECLKCDFFTCTCPFCNGSFFGGKCQHSCSEKCNGSVCDNTGHCWNTCRDGWHGINCTHQCGTNCVRCTQESGQCLKCKQGFHGIFCKLHSKLEKEVTGKGKSVDSWLIPLSITGWVMAIILAGIWCACCCYGVRGATKQPSPRTALVDVPPDSQIAQGADETLLGDVNPTSQAQRTDCEKEDTKV